MESQLIKKGKEKKSKKVFVGLSGGVDSAVSAAILKKEGFDVSGVFIKAWSPEGYPCTWREDRRSAMRVAAILDIPFFTLDLEKIYKEEVADYMIEEYKKGRTPNPDVMCNKEIKFGHFLKWAKEKGADFVATGHYARKISNKNNDKFFLAEGNDEEKDQSYFLWTLNQEQLKHIIFPVGDFKKEQVRKLAEKFNLPQAKRKDSQGLCFIGTIDMKDFLEDYIPEKNGDVLDIKGNKIGSHKGAVFFTIGERHGFQIDKKTSSEKPLYVISKNIEKNTITVSEKNSDNSFFYNTKEIILENTNWQGEDISKEITCRFIYRQNKIPCKLEKFGEKIKIIFKEKQGNISPGQSVVFYKGEKCLGGGVISN